MIIKQRRGLDKIILKFFSLFLVSLTILSAGFFYWPAKVFSADLLSVTINEVAWMGTMTSANDEWLELKNNTAEAIDLNGWMLKAASGSPSIILQGTIEANGYLLLERTSDETLPQIKADQIYAGALSNTGANLALYDAQSNPIDLIEAASGWPAGNNENKLTMERGSDGGWYSSLQPAGTPRAQNSVISEPESTNNEQQTLNNGQNASSTDSATSIEQYNNITIEHNNSSSTTTPASSGSKIETYDFSNDIYITEILPDPAGNDLEGEFIELNNQGSRPVNLNGWKLKAGEKSYEFKDKLIAANGYLSIYRKESKLVLNNGSSTVQLFLPGQNFPVQTVRYEQVQKAQSYALGGKGEWHWTTAITPGSNNQFVTANHPPKADFTVEGQAFAGAAVLFDSSDTEDEDDDLLRFAWQFGDGATSSIATPEHIFNRAGSFKVKLTVSDGKAEVSIEKNIKVMLSENKKADTSVKSASPGNRNSPVIINEILPNPIGEDADEEWIELYNRTDQPFDLAGWQLDDQTGGSKSFQFPDEAWVSAKGFYLIDRSESNLALNNSRDAVRLFDLSGQLVDQIDYVGAKEGLSYAQIGNGQWLWTKILTPAAVNRLDSVKEPIIKKAAVKVAKPKAAKSVKGVKIVQASARTDQLSVGQKVRIKGTVMVAPGILGAQIFYLATPQGLQVYNYRKDFPLLKIGDYIEVSGEVSESAGEKRLKTASAADIRMLGQQTLPEAQSLSCDEVEGSQSGQLVKLSGEITKKTAASFYLDDGTAETLVYIKNSANINKKDFAEGDNLIVTGLTNKTKSGTRILPRMAEDIVKVKPANAEVLGEAATSSEWAIPARDKKIELLNYLLWISAASIAVLVGLIFKIKKEKQ